MNQLSYNHIWELNQQQSIQITQLLEKITTLENNYLKMEDKYQKVLQNLKIENKKLLEEIEQIKEYNNKLKEDVSKKNSYYFKYIRLIQEINKLKAKIDDLNKKNQEAINEFTIESESNKKSEIWYDTTEYLLFRKNNNDSFDLFIQELIENAKVSVYGRRYSDFYKTICLGLYFTNTSSYKALQKIIPVPSITTLYYFSRQYLGDYKISLTSIEKTDFIFNEFKNTFFQNFESLINCSLAIDQTIGIRNPMFFNNHKKNNYLCLYYLQPINNFYPNVPIYIEFDLNGRMSKKTLENSKKIREIAKNNGFVIKYICTDADTPTNPWHTSIINKKYNPEIQSMYDSIKNMPELSFSTDFFHALKSQKKRFFRCKLYLNKKSQSVDKHVVRLYLGLTVGKSKAFTDESIQSGFKDKYALEFFSPKVLIESLKQKETISFAYYLLPFTFWYLADKVLFIGRQDRLNLLNIAFSIFQFELHNFPNSDPNDRFSSKKTKNTLKLSFYRKIDLIRYLNSIVCLGDSIKNSSENVGTERISTKCEENFFGNVRSDLNDSLDADLFLSIVARKIIKKKIFFQNNIVKIPNYKENNIAGVPTYNDDDNIDIDDKKIINECFYIRKFVVNEISTFSEKNIPETIQILKVLNIKPYLSTNYSEKNESYTSGSQLLCRFNMIKNKHYFSQPNEI